MVALALSGAGRVQVPVAGALGTRRTLWLLDEAAAALESLVSGASEILSPGGERPDAGPYFIGEIVSFDAQLVGGARDGEFTLGRQPDARRQPAVQQQAGDGGAQRPVARSGLLAQVGQQGGDGSNSDA